MHLYTILCGVFHLSAVIQSTRVKQVSGVLSATVGESVTLHCQCESTVAMHFSWYRQTLGGRPEHLCTFYKYDNPSKILHWLKQNPRFSVQREDGLNNLHILDVHFSDSATYFCGSSHSNIVEFGEGVFLSVKGARPQEVVQGPSSATAQSGGSVTLNCTVLTGTCDGVQGVVHAHRDQCEHVSTPGSSSKSCVYQFQKMNLSSSDTGTYHCAVASCGDILFGNGSKLLVTDDVQKSLAQMRTLVWLSSIRAGILLLLLAVCLLVFISKSKRSP